MEQGVVHGDNYELYTDEDIRKITNYEFLEKLHGSIMPQDQPWNEIEMDYLNRRLKLVNEQMFEVLLNEME